LRGAILTRQEGGNGTASVPYLIEQLHSPDAAMVNVALWVVQRELPGAEVTQAVAAELGQLPLERQLQVIRALGGRGDPAALPALLALLKSGEKSVRLAVLQTLPQVGGGLPEVSATSVVPALIEALGDPDGDLTKAAQECLERLPGPAVEAAVTALLDSAEKGRRLAALELLGQRRVKDAVPALLKAARDPEPEVRLAALKGLEELAGPAEMMALLDLLTAAPTPQDLDGTERALGAVCVKAGDPEGCAEKVNGALSRARTGEIKQALLRVLGSVGGSQALQSVRAAVHDPDAEVRATAIRLLSEWKTMDAAPYLLELATTATHPTDQLLGLRGYLSLAGNKDVAMDQRLTICQQAAALVQRDEEKRLLLGMLGTIPAPKALALVMPYLDDPATQEEACAAALSIAEQLMSGGDTSTLVEPLQKVVGSTANADVAKRAQALLEQLKGRK
jgi:HEAT repeat protein